MSTPLDRVQHLLVTPDNQPRQIEGLDTQRCVELHNAILEHGWLSSGRSAADFQSLCTPGGFYERFAEVIDGKCHASLKAFFQSARDVSPGTSDFSFFYNVCGLSCAFGEHGYYTEDDDQVLTLYTVSEGLYSDADGLVYDQYTHKAMMHFDIGDEMEEWSPWQPLESILSVWIEMIQRGKVVALRDDVCKASYNESDWRQDADGNWQEFKGPERDPTTGVIRIGQAPPWTIVPWTKQDLTECLELWETIVDMVEDRMSLSPQAHEHGLVDPSALEALHIPEGFASVFISQARKPRFDFIAPGLRVTTTDSFANQPFVPARNLDEQLPDTETSPILLLRSENDVSTSSLSPLSFDYPYVGLERIECPAGLYLGRCDRTSHTPFEDGCELLLPFEFEKGWAQQSDLSDLVDRAPHEGLLQSGVNPFNQRHPFQLKGFLEVVARNVWSGDWLVDRHGVAGGIEIWKQADTEKWRNYWLPLGPGRFW